MRRIEYLGRFYGAVERGDLKDALREAACVAEDEPLSIHEALPLLLLIARREDSRLSSAIELWWKKFEGEKRPACDQEIARAALGGLRQKVTRPRCELVLRDLMSWVKPEP